MKNKSEIFYETMGYPKPSNETLSFFHITELSSTDSLQHHPQICDLFNREGEQSDRMKQYIVFCDSYWSIWKSIPFVEQVYLANSITFNALHEWSDVDVLIIAKSWKLWLVRLFVRITLFAKWILRTWSRVSKKICTSFLIDSSQLNLYPLLIQPLDIYLIFWLAHLVPWYSSQIKESDKIWKYNKRLKGYMPHHPLKQVIRLENNFYYGTTKLRDIIEKILWKWFGDICNKLVSIIRKPIMLRKRRKLGKMWWGIVISDTMLKFHGDKRKDIALRFKSRNAETVEQ